MTNTYENIEKLKPSPYGMDADVIDKILAGYQEGALSKTPAEHAHDISASIKFIPTTIEFGIPLTSEPHRDYQEYYKPPHVPEKYKNKITSSQPTKYNTPPTSENTLHNNYAEPTNLSETETVIQREPTEIEQHLMNSFSEILDEISVAGIAQLPKGAKLPRNIHDYCLVAITASSDFTTTRVAPGSAGANIPEGVKIDYKYEGGKPFLDGGLTIGLVYQGGLSAIASAQVTADDKLRIVQLQGVTLRAKHDPENPKAKYSSGLFSTFQWRDSLIKAWMTVAAKAGISTVEIQGAQNNRWKDAFRIDFANLVKGYDKVAQRMGFTYDSDTSDWRLALPAPNGRV